MIDAFKAEVRKLLTVRSTYYFIIAAVLIILLYAGYATGYRVSAADRMNPTYLVGQIFGAVQVVTILGGLAGMLILANEYRHNTIIYTLSLGRSRSQILAAKILTISLFMVVFTLCVMVLSPLATIVGAQLHGYHLVHQVIDYPNVLWRSLFYGWGYGMLALILIAIIRNQIGAIVALLLIPSTVETLLSLLLKNNTKYLPFTALGQMTQSHTQYNTTLGKSAIVALAYIVGGWIVAWILFLRRDAN